MKVFGGNAVLGCFCNAGVRRVDKLFFCEIRGMVLRNDRVHSIRLLSVQFSIILSSAMDKVNQYRQQPDVMKFYIQHSIFAYPAIVPREAQ